MLDYAALPQAQRAAIESFLEQALADDTIGALQIERQADGLLLVNVWAAAVTGSVAALLDECQAEAQRAGVAFIALRAAGGLPPIAAAADALWLTCPDRSGAAP
ncbi:MAG: hypothetical protein ACYC5O_14740 [Anaerolineae bacterium]